MKPLYFGMIVCLAVTSPSPKANCGEEPARPEIRPPVNNEYSGFPVGSWATTHDFQEAMPDILMERIDRQNKMVISEVRANGEVEFQTFYLADKKWVRHLYSSASGTSARVTLGEWVPSPDRERIVHDGKAMKKQVDPEGWTETHLPDEQVKIGEKLVDCTVRQWIPRTGKAPVSLRLWFGKDVRVPVHTERFGTQGTSVLAAPDVVKMEWSEDVEGKKRIYGGALISLSERREVDGKPYDCAVWESSTQWGKQDAVVRKWLHDSVPGRCMKREVRRKDTGGLLSGTEVTGFGFLAAPLPPDKVKAQPGPWTSFAVGDSAEYLRTESAKPDQKSTWRRTYLGLNQDGYAIIKTECLEGEDAGITTDRLEIPWPDIREQDVKVKEEKDGPITVGGRKLDVTRSRYNCKDEWNRPWEATLITCKTVKLPFRDFSNWFVDASMGPDTLFAGAMVANQVLTRKVVSLEETLKVGDKEVKCIKEEEATWVKGQVSKRTYWSSMDIPGHFVKSSGTKEDGEKANEIVVQVTAFRKVVSGK